jgi:transcriptional regulator with XRE-family HTH domain
MRPDLSARLRDIGNQLRRLRHARGLTLRETTDRVNDVLPEGHSMSLALLGFIEKDAQPTTTEKLEAILHVLGARLVITSEEDPPLPPSLPEDRTEIARLFLAVLPVLPAEEVEILQHQLRLWRHRYEVNQRP